MPTELGRPTSPLARPARSLVDALGSVAPAVLWRALHPLARERFSDAAPPPPLRRHEVHAADRWTLVLREVPPCPGGAGEPVLLLPTLGTDADVFRCGLGPTLVGALVEAGFRVFLGDHRASVAATPPVPGAEPTFDDLVAHDVQALLAAASEISGYPRVHVVGHGLGGQAALASAAVGGADAVATFAVLSTPVTFPTLPTALRGLAALVDRLPGAWRLPTRRLARWGTALVPPSTDARAPRRRAALVHAIDDVPVAVLVQIAAWLREGALCDRDGVIDYGRALRDVRAPLWVGLGDGDGLCPAACALPLRDAWQGGPVTVRHWQTALDHLDVVLHPAAADEVHAPLVAWLVGHRVRAWRTTVVASGA